MKKHVIPDTNVILRYLLNDHQEHFRHANDFFDKVFSGEQPALILESVVAECLYVLLKAYSVPKEDAAHSLIELLRYKGIVNKEKQELISALNLFEKTGLDFVDCVVLAKAGASKFEVFTFDKQMIKVSRQI